MQMSDLYWRLSIQHRCVGRKRDHSVLSDPAAPSTLPNYQMRSNRRLGPLVTRQIVSPLKEQVAEGMKTFPLRNAGSLNCGS